jgi:radical SAM protein with 4Fe4S-binding SPASM domain
MKCQTCIRAPGENFDMPFDLFRSIIGQLRSSLFGTKQVDLTGVGEPLLSRNLISMVKYAKKAGFRVGFTSNFTFMDKEKAKELIQAKVDYIYVSMDSARKETFEKMRVGANFEDVMSKVKLFAETRREMNSPKLTLKLTVTLSRESMKEIPELIKLAEDLGVDSVNFNMPIYPEKQHCIRELPSLPTWKEKPGTRVSIGRRAIWLKKPQPCVAMKGCFITYDGKVLPCNGLMQLLPRAEYGKVQLGDLKNNTLEEVWFSGNYRRLRTMLALGINPAFCRYCPRPYQI